MNYDLNADRYVQSNNSLKVFILALLSDAWHYQLTAWKALFIH